MRILVVTPYFYPHKGGSQQYAEELHYHLMKSDPSITVDVLCYNTDNAKKTEKYRGLTIHRVPCWQPLTGQFAIPNYFLLFKTLRKLFKKNKYDIINSHTRFFESSWWVPIVAKLTKSKSVLTDHCAHHPIHDSRFVNAIARTVDVYLVPLITRLYDTVTVTNQATFSFLSSLGIPKAKIMYGGVDTQFYTPRKRQGVRKLPKAKKQLNNRDILVTFVGRMIPSKGPQILFDAVKDIVAKNSDIHVIFAGDGEMCVKLSKKSVENIYFTGALERKDVAQLMANTDILVHPSLHHEGFPNVLLEAGSSGCAVIATDKGGTNEIIEHNKTGILVNPDKKSINEAITLLTKSPKVRSKLSKALRSKVKEKYDWNKIVSNYSELIEYLAR